MKKPNRRRATDIGIRAEPIRGVPTEPNTVVTSLSLTEQVLFRECETILRTGLKTFLEVGSALLTIRENRLYRGTHETFESYCNEYWGISRTYAWRVIGAAERVKLLPENYPKPNSEFQMRPFLKIKTEDFPKVWKQALRKAKNGKVTPRLAEILVQGSPEAVQKR